MATTVTPENVSRIEVLNKKDPKMAYAEIRDIMKIFIGKSHAHFSRLPWLKKTLCPLRAP